MLAASSHSARKYEWYGIVRFAGGNTVLVKSRKASSNTSDVPEKNTCEPREHKAGDIDAKAVVDAQVRLIQMIAGLAAKELAAKGQGDPSNG